MNIWVLMYKIGKIALVVLSIAACATVFIPQIRRYQELRRKEAVLQEELRLEEDILKHLKTQQDKLQTDPRFVEKVAREEFGLAKPGETVFKFVEDEPQAGR